MRTINLLFNVSDGTEYSNVNVNVDEIGTMTVSVMGKNTQELKEMYDIISRIPTTLYSHLFKGN